MNTFEPLQKLQDSHYFTDKMDWTTYFVKLWKVICKTPAFDICQNKKTNMPLSRKSKIKWVITTKLFQ